MDTPNLTLLNLQNYTCTHTYIRPLHFITSVFSPLLCTFRYYSVSSRAWKDYPSLDHNVYLCLLSLFTHMLDTVPSSWISKTSSSARQHTAQFSCMTYVHAAHVWHPEAEHWGTHRLPAAATAPSTQPPVTTSAKPQCTRKREQTSSTFKMRFAIWQIPRECLQYETEVKRGT